MCCAKAPCTSAIRAAKAVIEEVPQAANSSVRHMAKCSLRNGERDVHRMSSRCLLTLPIQITQALVANVTIPILLLSSWLKFLLQHNLWHTLSGLREPDLPRCDSQWGSFWRAYRKICPRHPVFEKADRGEINLDRCAALIAHGDEGRTKKKSAIFILSAHSVLGLGSHATPPSAERYNKQKLNFLGHTWSTRWMLGVLPKSYYDKAGGDNFFQDYLDIFATDILSVYEQGVLSVTGNKHHFVIINVIGDWPFLAKAFSLSRCFANVCKQSTSRKAPTGICHCCLADRIGYPWEDFESQEPAWRQTINAESPFKGAPALMRLPHDPSNPPGFLGQDCFHAWHLGAAKQFLASCLVLLSETFPGNSIPSRFERMSAIFFSWCKEQKQHAYIRKLTRDTVGWPSHADYPCGSWSKGSTSTCLLKWILFVSRERAALIEEGSLLHGAVRAARQINAFFSKLYREDTWIERSKAIEIASHGFSFLRLHGHIAKQAWNEHRALFLMMPNLHRLHHLFFCLRDYANRSDLALNVNVWNCQVEEDYIGRPSRVSRRVAPQRVIQRTLQRGLQAASAKFTECGFLIRDASS